MRITPNLERRRRIDLNGDILDEEVFETKAFVHLQTKPLFQNLNLIGIFDHPYLYQNDHRVIRHDLFAYVF